jgi:hypothetical protein
MQLMITTMTVYISYNFTYSIFIRLFSPHCTNVFIDHSGMNNLLWFVSRGMSDYFWIYPFIYMFWPKAVKMETRKRSQQDGDGTPEVDYTIVDEESDDEIESIYPSGTGRSLSNMRSLVKTLTYSVATPGTKRRVMSTRLSVNPVKSADGYSDSLNSQEGVMRSSGKNIIGSNNPVVLPYSERSEPEQVQFIVKGKELIE